jgi:hypothetical protein
MDGLKRRPPDARHEARVTRTLQNDKAFDLFCETILRGRRDRAFAIAIHETARTAWPLIHGATLQVTGA